EDEISVMQPKRFGDEISVMQRDFNFDKIWGRCIKFVKFSGKSCRIFLLYFRIWLNTKIDISLHGSPGQARNDGKQIDNEQLKIDS
ncbi:hypothetical protein J7L48_06945, partial [bacterium]|nr:hypothetical protein [bacterium]